MASIYALERKNKKKKCCAQQSTVAIDCEAKFSMILLIRYKRQEILFHKRQLVLTLWAETTEQNSVGVNRCWFFFSCAVSLPYAKQLYLSTNIFRRTTQRNGKPFLQNKKKNKKINSKPRCQHKNNLHALLVQTKTNPFFRCWRYNVPWNVLPTTPHHTAQTYVLDRVYNKIPLGILFSLRLLLSHQHLLKAKTIGPNAEYARDFIILLFCVSSMAV